MTEWPQSSEKLSEFVTETLWWELANPQHPEHPWYQLLKWWYWNLEPLLESRVVEHVIGKLTFLDSIRELCPATYTGQQV